MPSAGVTLRGWQWLLPAVENLTKTERLHLWRTVEERRELTLAFVRRKLGALRQGVHLRRITGSRTARSSHRGLVQTYTRLLLGQTHAPRRLRKRRLSHFMRRKVLVHLLLTRPSELRVWQVPVASTRVVHPPPQPTMELMLRWVEVRTAMGRVPTNKKSCARGILEAELRTAYSCSYSTLFGAA